MNKYPRHCLGSVDVGQSLPIEKRIGELKDQLRECMGKEKFTDFYVSQHTWDNELMEKRLLEKLEELHPDTLFREVLENRQNELLAVYPKSDNQEEITLEMAEIGVELEER